LNAPLSVHSWGSGLIAQRAVRRAELKEEKKTVDNWMGKQ